jgi:DNA-binding NarL/FixJ family response regulator
MTRKTHEDGHRWNIIIVDDHPIIRKGLADLIKQEHDLNVCGAYDEANAALAVMESLKPDLAIVDITLRDTSGIELIKDIKIRFPKLPVLVLSMHDESFYAERALRAGARGYVMKEEASEKVMTAIRRVLAGEVYLSESVAARMLSKYVDGRPEQGSNPVERLSDRELEVFELIGRGLGTSQIAEKLHRSIKTIEAHRANIKRKLQLRTSPELLRMALQWVQTQETA